MQDPLVQFRMPLPEENPADRVAFLESEDDQMMYYLTTLSRLSSPIRPVIKPSWMVKTGELEKLMNESNIQPLVLFDTTPKYQEIVDQIRKVSLLTYRKVLIVGSPGVVVRPPTQRLRTGILSADLNDLMTIPLEGIGAMLLRRFARNEPLDAPIESREARRQRLIKERTGNSK